MKNLISNGSNRSQYTEIIIVNPSIDKDFKMLDKDEFSYRGRMYDVISTRFSGNSVIFHASMTPGKSN